MEKIWKKWMNCYQRWVITYCINWVKSYSVILCSTSVRTREFNFYANAQEMCTNPIMFKCYWDTLPEKQLRNPKFCIRWRWYDNCICKLIHVSLSYLEIHVVVSMYGRMLIRPILFFLETIQLSVLELVQMKND